MEKVFLISPYIMVSAFPKVATLLYIARKDAVLENAEPRLHVESYAQS